MKRVKAPSFRGRSTITPETVADEDTGPSTLAPLGSRGARAIILVPVGAAAPADAEIVTHAKATSDAATSARTPRKRFMNSSSVRLAPPP